jgi:FkbM family methyltransferase
MTYYSQHGEDFFLDQIFKNQREGFFVEVGCIDGRRFSNTLTFEERGWKGLCVEAHAGYIELLKKNRPNSIVCHCAAGEKDEDEVPFYANSRGSLSTLDKSQEEHFRKKYGVHFTGFELQRVPKRRLDTLFKQNEISKIDLLSIDIEGYEIEALKGIDFSRYRPRVIVVETQDREEEQKLDQLFEQVGYHRVARLACNLFYAFDATLSSKVHDKCFQGVSLLHTAHPLDHCGDQRVKVRIDTRTAAHVGVLRRWVQAIVGFER